MEEKYILDACCGGRMMWFNKKHPNALYIDIRRDHAGFIPARPNFEVEPDIEMDYRDLKFSDGKFDLVVWDPPHTARKNNRSWVQQKYGMLSPDSWANDLELGFKECFRVLRARGVLIFKWSESEISLSKILPLFPVQPLFGSRVGKDNKTIWLTFIKKDELPIIGF